MKIALPIRKRERIPAKMPRQRLVTLTARLMAAKSLPEAAQVLRNYASRVAHAAPRLSKLGKWGKWADWRRTMLRLARGLATGEAQFPCIMLEGNVKLPFATFSTLPVFTCPGAGECATWCYSLRSWRYASPWARQVQNTLLLKYDAKAVALAFLGLPRGIVFRLYVDGDFNDESDVDFWMRLIAKRPDIRAYGYSKSWDLVFDYSQTHTMPGNYLLNLSSGGAAQHVSRERLLREPWVRGNFLSLPVDYHPGVMGNIGFKRYDDPEYHRAVRRTAAMLGLKVFSCPGKCGPCALGRHACGSNLFKNITIAIGIH